MKVALIHDYLKEYGGAERVLEALHEIWPEAPVYTTVFLPEFLGPHKKRFEGWDIRTSWMQKIPYVHKLISPIRLLTPWFFENLDLTSYDVVIVSATGAYFPNLINRKENTVHVCYCHTPPRYLYGYPTARDWRKHAVGRVVGSIANHHLRMTDFVSAQRPDFFIANSHEVQRRIEKFYRREAEVIYPPVNISSINSKPASLSLQRGEQLTVNKKKLYYLAGGRLARAKHIDLVIKACNKLKVPLKVFGRGFADYDRELRKIAGPTIEFVGEVNDLELAQLYSGAKALLFASEMEDFGIMPVEAMGYGIPVVALNQGGVKETVVNGKTGILFDELSVDSIISAIRKLEKAKIKREDCIKQAQRFSKNRFKREILSFVNRISTDL